MQPFFTPKRAGFILFFLSVFLWTYSQDSRFPSQSPYTLLFRLNATQARIFHDNPPPGKIKLDKFQKLADTLETVYLPPKRKPLPYGQYLGAYVEEGFVHTHQFQRSPFTLWIDGEPRKEVLKIRGMEGPEPPPVQVFWKGKEVIWSAEANGFPLKGNTFLKDLEIRTGENVWFYTLLHNGSQKDKSRFAPEFATGGMIEIYKKKGKGWDGVMILSQPEYRIGDTLMMKAVVRNKKGKRWDKPVRLEIWRGSKKIWEQKELKPARPGAFVYEIPLGDTLQIDQAYRVILRHPQKWQFISQKFWLKDYELDEITFKASLKKLKFRPGEPMKLFMSGTDAAGNVPANLRAKISLVAEYPQVWDEGKVFLPSILWEKELTLPPDPDFSISIPDSIFPRLSAWYSVNIEFLTPTGEVQDKKVRFFRELNASWFNWTLREPGFVHLERKSPGEEFSEYVEVQIEKKHEQPLPWQSVELPAKIDFDPAVTGYRIRRDGKSEYFPVKQWGSQFTIREELKDGLAVFKVENPLALPFYWEIRDGKKLREKGWGTSLDWKGKLRKGKALGLFVRYQFAGEGEVETAFLANFEEQLKIEIKQEEQVYPGQKATIKLLVTRKNGEPVSGIDLTAWAVNSQFSNLVDPEIPWWGKSHPVTIKNNGTIAYPHEREGTQWIQRSEVSRFSLDSAAYYQLCFPDTSGKTAIYFPVPVEKQVQSNHGQVAPYLMKKGRQQPIYLMKWNGKPFYHYLSISANHYSLALFSGIGTLELRTWDKWITIPHVEIRPGMKLEFAIDMENLPADVKVEEAKKGKLDKEEWRKWEKCMLALYHDHNGSRFSLREGPMNQVEGSLAPRMKEPREHRQFWMGPFSSPLLSLKYEDYQEVPFHFDPRYQYEFRPHLITREPVSKKWKEQLRKLDPQPDQRDFGELWPVWPQKHDPWAWLTTDPLHFQGEIPWDLGEYEESDYSVISSFPSDVVVKYQVLFRQGDEQNFWYQMGEKREWDGLTRGNYALYFVKENADFTRFDFELNEEGTWHFDLRNAAWQHSDSLEKVFRTVQQTELDGKAVWRNHARAFGEESFTGVLVNHSRQPVAGEVVHLMDRDMHVTLARTQTGPNGEFEFSDIAKGAYVLAAWNAKAEVAFLQTVVGDSLSLTDTLCLGQKEMIEKVREGRPRSACSLGSSYLSDIYLRQGGIHTRFGLRQGNFLEPYLQLSSNREINDDQMMAPGVVLAGSGTRKLKAVTISERKRKVAFPRMQLGGFKLEKTGKLRPWDTGAKWSESWREGPEATEISSGTYWVDGSRVVSELDSTIGYADNEDLNPYRMGGEALKASSGMRDVFLDRGYWKPLLLTGADGTATFQVTYPGNVTTWKESFLAMGSRGEAGYLTTRVRSFKPVMARLSLPRFMVEGDGSMALGRFDNLLDEKLKAKISFFAGEKQTASESINLNRYEEKRFPIQAIGTDSLAFKLQLELPEEDYVDGEERKIPVFPKGTLDIEGEFHVLDAETTFTRTFSAGTIEKQVYVQTSLIGVYLDIIKELETYPHGCNEQLASGLRALLVKKQVLEMQGERFREDRKVRKIISKLERNQQENGSWGWFGRFCEREIWMTAYVTQVLYEAKNQGFSTESSLLRAQRFLSGELGIHRENPNLYAMKVLLETGGQVDVPTLLDAKKVKTPSTWEQLEEVRIRQMAGLPYDSTLVHKAVKIAWAGGGHPENWGIMDLRRSIPLNILLIDILRHEGGFETEVRLLEDQLLFRKSPNGYLNTLQTATILEALLPRLEEKNFGMYSASLEVLSPTGKVLYTLDSTQKVRLPDNTSQLKFRKRGEGPLYFTAWERFWEPEPEPVDSFYEIKTELLKEGKPVEKLTFGEPVELKVTVNAKKPGEYLMLEVPIPAGCSYGASSTSYGETHREYFRNKTCIYIRSLTTGKHTYKIRLEPRFPGKYTLNPARIESMYFPVFSGRNGMKSTVVKLGE